MEKFAYLELSKHGFAHVVSTNKDNNNYAEFINGGLTVHSGEDTFNPAKWVCVPPETPDGVHKTDSIESPFIHNATYHAGCSIWEPETVISDDDKNPVFEFINHYVWQSGGHCYVDVINGKSESFGVTGEAIVYYPKVDCASEHGEPEEEVFIVNLVESDITLSHKYSTISSINKYGFVLNNEKFYGFSELKSIAMNKMQGQF